MCSSESVTLVLDSLATSLLAVKGTIVPVTSVNYFGILSLIRMKRVIFLANIK